MLESKEDVEAWVKARPEATRQLDAVVLASRAALRVLPYLMTYELNQELSLFNRFLEIGFRVVSTARFFAFTPSRSATLDAVASTDTASRALASNIYTLTMTDAARSADAANPYAFAPLEAATYAALAAGTVASTGAFAAHAAACAASAAADTGRNTTTSNAAFATAWEDVSKDAWTIERQGAETTIRQKLRSEYWPYPLFRKNWHGLRRYLNEEMSDGSVWVEWYERIMDGVDASREVEEAYVFLDDPTFWDDPAAANAAIRKKLDEIKARENGLQGEIPFELSPEPPQVPRPKPAAIEPIWQDDQLVLPRSPLQADLSPADLIAALTSLQEALREVADDAKEEGNLDPRIARSLNRLADRIPTGQIPEQHVLFTLGHGQEKLVDLHAVVMAEASAVLGSDYQSLLRQFDRVVRQFPRWREYVRNAEKDKLTAEDISKARQAAKRVEEALRDETGQKIFDPAIAEVIADMLAMMPDPEQSPQSEETIHSGASELAQDLLESINNIAKGLADRILATKDDFNTHWEHDKELLRTIWQGKTLADMRQTYKKAFAARLKKWAEAAGTATADGIGIALVGLALLAIGYALGIGPAASITIGGAGSVAIQFDKKFQWLKNFLEHFRR